MYAAFGFLILVGFGSLALYGFLKKEGQTSEKARAAAKERERIEVVVWGTLDADKAEPVFSNLRGGSRKGYHEVHYIEKDTATIEDEFARAIAYNERVPDLLLLESTEVLAFDDKNTALDVIPFGYYPLMTVADYQKMFIPPTDIFLRAGGYIALPMLADSMVLYYNEGLRRQHDLRQLPKVWKDFTEKQYQEIAKQYRENDKAMAPLGAYGNYANAPYLFAALLLQAQEFGAGAPPVIDLVSFYTKFATLRSPVQTWNEGFLSARNMFIGNQMLFYPGFMSEYRGLQRANPNIVIQTTALPQLSGDSVAAVPTKLYALAIPQKGQYKVPAYRVVFDMAAVLQQFPTEIFGAISLPPPINGFDRDTMTKTVATNEDAEAVEQFFNAITNTEQVFLDTLYTGKNIRITPATRTALLNVLKEVTIGIRTAEQGAKAITALFE